MHAIVLGAGLMGTATAYFLACRGVKVTMIERRLVGGGATVASFANIRRSGRALSQLPLANRSLALWGQLEDRLGRDVEFRAKGHLRLIFDADGLERMRTFKANAKPYGLHLEELGPDDLKGRFPGIGPTAIGASFSPADGSANPRLVAAAFADAAARLGANVLAETDVSDIEHSSSGFTLSSSKGTVCGDILVNCAGAHGPEIAKRFDEDVPYIWAGPQMGVTEPLPYKIHPVIGIWSNGPGGYLRQVERGNVVFGGSVPRQPVGKDGFARPDPMSLVPQLREIVRFVPALRGVSVIRQWSGCEGYIEDDLPIIGPSATTEGLYHAFGFCGHGFQLGPGVGDTMAELITTGATTTPIEPFHIDRFAA
ncbi:MAG: FAD-binding oxidoreductase [Pseudomonadota bacterium]